MLLEFFRNVIFPLAAISVTIAVMVIIITVAAILLMMVIKELKWMKDG